MRLKEKTFKILHFDLFISNLGYLGISNLSSSSSKHIVLSETEGQMREEKIIKHNDNQKKQNTPPPILLAAKNRHSAIADLELTRFTSRRTIQVVWQKPIWAEKMHFSLIPEDTFPKSGLG